MEKRNERKADLLRQAGQRQLMVAVGSFLFLIAYLFLLSQWVMPQLAALPSSGWLMRFVFIVCTCNYTEQLYLGDWAERLTALEQKRKEGRQVGRTLSVLSLVGTLALVVAELAVAGTFRAGLLVVLQVFAAACWRWAAVRFECARFYPTRKAGGRWYRKSGGGELPPLFFIFGKSLNRGRGKRLLFVRFHTGAKFSSLSLAVRTIHHVFYFRAIINFVEKLVESSA